MFKLFNICVFAIFIIACKNAPDSDEATVSDAKEESKMNAGKSFTVDVNASRIEWIGTKVSGYHIGTIKLKSGELSVTGNEVTAGNFILDMTTVVATGPEKVPADASAKLTGHLRSPDFFDTGKFPEATFAITGVKAFTGTVNEADDPQQEKLNEYKVANPTHTISGNLTVKGITKNIEFPASINIQDAKIEAKAKFNIDRREWNIVYAGQPDDLIRDEIHLGILLVAKK